jgi:hypothetical protein
MGKVEENGIFQSYRAFAKNFTSMDADMEWYLSGQPFFKSKS